MMMMTAKKRLNMIHTFVVLKISAEVLLCTFLTSFLPAHIKKETLLHTLTHLTHKCYRQ